MLTRQVTLINNANTIPATVSIKNRSHQIKITSDTAGQ